MSKEAEMMKNLDELLKRKIGRTKEGTPMSIDHFINGNTPKCRDCKYFIAYEKEKYFHVDGYCTNEKHIKSHSTVKERKIPYYCTGRASACFDAEEKGEYK